MAAIDISQFCRNFTLGHPTNLLKIVFQPDFHKTIPHLHIYVRPFSEDFEWNRRYFHYYPFKNAKQSTKIIVAILYNII